MLIIDLDKNSEMYQGYDMHRKKMRYPINYTLHENTKM